MDGWKGSGLKVILNVSKPDLQNNLIIDVSQNRQKSYNKKNSMLKYVRVQNNR